MRRLTLRCCVLLLCAAAPFVSMAQTPQVPPPANESPKAVLVTGASTGIGRRITEHLASKGYFVYAGARKQADLDALNAIRNVQAVRLDVTRQEDIDAAVETVTKGGRGLYGLVNNAGIGSAGSVAEMTMQEFDLTMQVNVYGPFRMAKAFQPLIVASKGRITNIGSISGILAGRNLAAYTMSKHAVEAFTDSLAAQLEPQGVLVNVVEPGNYDSDIGRNAVKRTGVESPGADRSRFRKPDEVAAAVELALFEEKPKRRYMVVPEQREAEITIKKQLEQLVQLNEDHPYSYSRDQLIGMLDAELAKTRPTAPGAAQPAPE